MKLSISVNKVIIAVVGAVGVSILAGEEDILEEMWNSGRVPWKVGE